MTDTVTIDAGILTASEDDRTATGLLVPYGETCRSNIGTFSVDPGVFTIPADVPGTVGLNVEHRREDAVGRGVVLTDTPAGVVATFSFARTPEGDQARADALSGRRRNLSVEAAGIRIRDGRAVAGRIFGAALVERPAFPSATLLAAAVDTPEDTDTDDVDEPQPPGPDAPAPDPDTPDPDPEETETDSENEENTMAETATVPDTLTAARPAAVDTSLARFATLLASRNRLGGSPEYAQALRELAAPGETLFAALSDVAIGGTPGPGVATGVQPPQYIGELWQKVPYQRRFVPLMAHADLTSLAISGWKWKTPPAVGPWSGNKSAVPSPPVETVPFSQNASRIAGAYDVGREFVDFDVPGFWESFWAAMSGSYAVQSDNKALADLYAGATSAAAVAPPAGVNPVVSAIITAAMRVLDYGTPAYGIVSSALFASIATITNAGQFPYLGVGEVSFPVYGPSVTIAGMPIIPAPAAVVGATTVVVAAREAATVYELPGSPIRVDGVLDMARGGVDPGLFGYLGTVIHQPLAIQAITGVAGALDAGAKK